MNEDIEIRTIAFLYVEECLKNDIFRRSQLNFYTGTSYLPFHENESLN